MSEGNVLTGVYRCPTHQRWYKRPLGGARFPDVDYKPIPEDEATLLALLALYVLGFLFETGAMVVFVVGMVTDSARTTVLALIIGGIGFCFGVAAERIR